MYCMLGKLDKSDSGRWMIVDDSGARVEISAGELLEVWSFVKREWVTAKVQFTGRDYQAQGVPMFIGQPARSIGHSAN